MQNYTSAISSIYTFGVFFVCCFIIICYLCTLKLLLSYMERKELEAYQAIQKRIYDFCEKVIEKLEADYEGVLEGTNCMLDDVIITKDFIDVYYSHDDDELYSDSFTMSIDMLLSEDVDACAKQIAKEIYSIDAEIAEEEGQKTVIKFDKYMN